MTTTEAAPEVRQKSVGQPMRRKEDARLVTGSTNWTDNIVLPGML
ncbi:MAG: aerobic carbon-monoxide dehydrogenase large subunit, partial [Actinomycetota bacterium]|nr:aerobic carbon-monoxide dehydrogenase large subunit [Actinomycetota bacterium]